MYEEFYGLNEKPFSLLPDPDFLFLSSKHSLALSMLEYSLAGQAGFCAITGEIGSGKTTLIRALLRRIDRDIRLGLISNTHSSHSDIAGWALSAFGRTPKGTTRAEIHQELMLFLIEEYGAGKRSVLIVDEAQNLTIQALEELRLLSNINADKDLLLQIILVGQPELLEKLRRPELCQFAQRISVSYHLAPLTCAETLHYITHRLRVAGATAAYRASSIRSATCRWSMVLPTRSRRSTLTMSSAWSATECPMASPPSPVSAGRRIRWSSRKSPR